MSQITAAAPGAVVAMLENDRMDPADRDNRGRRAPALAPRRQAIAQARQAGWARGAAMRSVGGSDREIPTRTLCGACHTRACHRACPGGALVPVVGRCGWMAGPGGFRCFPQLPLQRGTGRAGSFPCHSRRRRRQEDGRMIPGTSARGRP